MTTGRKDSGVKPAWSTAKVPVVGRPDLTQSDFPTAAEVAQGLLSSVFIHVRVAALNQAFNSARRPDDGEETGSTSR